MINECMILRREVFLRSLFVVGWREMVVTNMNSGAWKNVLETAMFFILLVHSSRVGMKALVRNAKCAFAYLRSEVFM